MNEIIQRCSAQADEYARSNNSAKMFATWQRRYTEKFTELLLDEVDDCVTWVGRINDCDHVAHAMNLRINKRLRND